MANTQEKMLNIICHWRHAGQNNSEIPLLEWQKFRTLTSNTGEDVELPEVSLTAGGTQSGAVT